MGLRNKTALIVCGTLIGLVLVVYLVTSNTVLKTFDRLQRDDIRKDVERVNNALKEDISFLEGTCGDLAVSAQTAGFFESGSQLDGLAALPDAAFTELKINFACLIDLQKQVVFKRAFDLGSLLPASFPQSLAVSGYFEKAGFSESDFISGRSGILMITESPIFYALKPVLRLDSTVAGYILTGRYLDSSSIQKISHNNNIYHLDFLRVTSIKDDSSLAEVMSELNSGTQIVTEYERGNTVIGYSYVRDSFGNPVFVARTDKPAKIFLAGQTSATVWIAVVLGVGFVFVGIIIFLMNKLVLSKILGLKTQVNAIDLTSRVSPRLSYRGKDELSGLTITLNHMLDRIEQSQMELRESETRYRRLFNNINDAVFLHRVIPDDSKLECLETNLVVSRLLGYDRPEILALNNLALICPDDQSEFLARLKNLRTEQKSVFEVRLLTREKQTIPMEFSSQAFEFHGQTVILSMARDITLRKKAEFELKESFREEVRLRQTLEDEIKRRAEFFRALVHELKTPLTPMLASSETMLDITRDDIMRRLATNIFRGAERLNSRIDELLDMARGEMGILKIQPVPLQLANLIRDVAQDMQPQFKMNNLEFILDIRHELPLVNGDESRLRQVMVNLLGNACKYTLPGGRVCMRAYIDRSFLQVDIADTGIGIESDQIPRLFKPYNRIENSRKNFSGLGLGLALSKQIIDLHHGEIRVVSRIGEGSVFSFNIPLNYIDDVQAEENKNFPEKVR